MSVKLRKLCSSTFILHIGEILLSFYFISETPVFCKRAFGNEMSNLPIDFVL